jgi:hypothetical protein
VWYFEQTASGVAPPDGRNSLEIIDQILDERCRPEIRLARRRTIFGIAGAAKGSFDASDVPRLISVLRMRYAGRPELDAITSHPDFPVFVDRRAEELLAPG